MKKIVVATVGILALAGCSTPKPTVENAANAQESDLVNRAAAMDAEAELATNAAAANAINSASATYNSSVTSDELKNGKLIGSTPLPPLALLPRARPASGSGAVW